MSILDRFARFYGPVVQRAAPKTSSSSFSFNPYSNQGQAAPQYNINQYLMANEKVSWLYAAVDRIALSVAETKWHLYTKPKRIGDQRKEIVDHDILDLMHQVNPFETWNEHLELSQQYMELAGEFFWLLVRNNLKGIQELWALNPALVEVIPSQDKYIAGYIYSNGGQQIPVEQGDIIHFKRPNPRNRYRGLSPVSAILTDIESQRFSSMWNRNFFRNSAEPGGVIEVPQDLSDEKFQRLLMQWSEEHRGTANAHQVAVLEGGAKWVESKNTQRDMQFDRLRKDNRDIILANYGLPLHILGIAESVNRANAEAGEYVFSRWVIKPRLVRIREKLNEQLLPKFDNKGQLELDFDDPVPENQEYKLRAAGEYSKGYMVKNEARALAGLEPDPEGDVYFIPSAGQEVPKDPKKKQEMLDQQQAAMAQQQESAPQPEEQQTEEPQQPGEQPTSETTPESAEDQIEQLFGLSDEKILQSYINKKQDVDAYLRYGYGNAVTQRQVAFIDSIINNAKPQSRTTTVWRKITATKDGLLPELHQGDILTDKTYIVTSLTDLLQPDLTKEPVPTLLIKINVPQGAHIGEIKGSADVILPRGSEVVIESEPVFVSDFVRIAIAKLNVNGV